jgi:hypothetical protein
VAVMIVAYMAHQRAQPFLRLNEAAQRLHPPDAKHAGAPTPPALTQGGTRPLTEAGSSQDTHSDHEVGRSTRVRALHDRSMTRRPQAQPEAQPSRTVAVPITPRPVALHGADAAAGAGYRSAVPHPRGTLLPTSVAVSVAADEPRVSDSGGGSLAASSVVQASRVSLRPTLVGASSAAVVRALQSKADFAFMSIDYNLFESAFLVSSVCGSLMDSHVASRVAHVDAVGFGGSMLKQRVPPHSARHSGRDQRV